jgi:hypothetical protein
LALIEGGEVSHLEWLGAVPSSRATKGLEEQIEKVAFLKELAADRLILPDLPLAGLEHFSRRMTSRKPAALVRIRDTHRTIEVACFLRLTMLRVTDASLTLLDHRIAALWRAARERAEDARASRLRRFRELLGDLAGLAGDEALDAAELRSRLQGLIARFETERDTTQVSTIRQEFGRKSQDLARLLKTARAAALHGRFIRDLDLPASPEQYLQPLEAGLTAGLAALAEAVEAGTVAIDGGELRLPRRKPGSKDPRIGSARQAFARAIGDPQFPDVLMEIDGLTRFSWILLGRPARSEQELVTLYAGLVSLGSDLSVAEVTRMVTPVAVDSLGQMVLGIEAGGRLRAANDAVLRFMREHRVATLWGRGLFASADVMSLEATRYLWSARLDPRRRTYAVGTYAHVLDQWGILYDQPIVLNRRQAGAAIEGALR